MNVLLPIIVELQPLNYMFVCFMINSPAPCDDICSTSTICGPSPPGLDRPRRYLGSATTNINTTKERRER